MTRYIPTIVAASVIAFSARASGDGMTLAAKDARQIVRDIQDGPAGVPDSLQQSILGEWVTAEGKARVRIDECGPRICGTIVWLKEPLKDGVPVVDDKNPEESLRGQPVIGLRIVRNFEYDGDGEWSSGTVYDPESGNDYKGKITLGKDGTLELRGYVLIPLFGRSETWIRWKGE